MSYRSPYRSSRPVGSLSSRRTPSLAGLGCLGFILLVLLVGGCNYAVFSATKGHHTFTVEDKITKRNSDGGDKYLIFTDKGTFENTDSIFALKFRSSDLYGKLKVNHKYACTTVGLRIPLFSSYKNLLDCEEIRR